MMKVYRNSFFYLCLLILISGCSWFSWLPFVDEPDKEANEPVELLKFAESVRVSKQWSKKVGNGLGKKYLRLAPIIVADQIIAADTYGVVSSFNRFTGKLTWTTRIGQPANRGLMNSLKPFARKDLGFVSGGIGSGEGILVLGTTSGEVVALNAGDGSERWRTNVSSEILNAPGIGRERVFVLSNNGHLAGLDINTGERVWGFDSQVPILTLRGSSAPVAVDDLVFAGFANGKVAAFREETGEQVWEQRIMLPEGRSDLDRIVDVDGTPHISNGLLFAASYQGRLKAIRLRDGAVLWERNASSFLELSTGYNQVYIVDDSDTITALEMGDATEAWKQSGLGYRQLTSPLAFSNYLVVGDDEGYLHVLAQSDGRFLGRKKISGSGLRSNMIVADGILYCLSNDGRLSALTISEVN